MREYKLVYLNKGFSASREKDIQKAEDKINEMSDEELREYFMDSEADRTIEEEKSNPSNYYYEP